MTSRVAMDTMRPDERAAGVISGSDPYRELELYLEKVNEEIGEVFDQWQNNRKPSQSIPIPRTKKIVPLPPPRNFNSNKERQKREDITAWSDGLLAEFNNIIKQELNQLENNHDVTPNNRNNMRLRISRSRSLENGTEVSGTPPPSPASDNSSNCSPSLHHRAFRLAKVLRRQRSPLVPGECSGEAVLVSVSSLPDSDVVHLTASDSDLAMRKLKNSSLVSRSDSTSALARLTRRQVIEHQNNRLDRIPPDHDADARDVMQEAVDAGTQTSPPLSRSSSFTWVSTSSLLLNTDDEEEEEDDDEDNRSTTSSSSCSPQRSTDCVSSRDSLSDSPLGSVERDEPESGIGTASPPRSKEHTPVSSSSKVRRKETWERLRRRASSGRPVYRVNEDVWVRRESVETQTRDDCSSLPRAVRPRCLPIKPQQPSPSDERQSPSTASLKLTTTPLAAELGNKSSSAPILVKQAASPGAGGGKPEDNAKKRVLTQPRSQSERHLAEIEAAEACKWLRAAGFPQYAQMYEDLQFPIDVSGVQKDHPFLDPDSLQSLFRRLHALNRCAKMKVDNIPKNTVDDSDDDDPCALSENWTFQPESRRWSRVCEVTAQHAERLQALSAGSEEKEHPRGDGEDEHEDFSDDRLLDQEEDYDPDEIPVISSLRYGSLPPGHPAGDSDMLEVRFRRTGSERLRDGAKALLRRMESLKSRRRRRQNREGVVISGPQVVDVTTMQQRMKDLNCVDVSPTGTSPEQPPSGLAIPSSPSSTSTPTPSPASGTLVPGFGDDSSSYCSDGSQGGGTSTAPPHHRGRSKLNRAKKLLHHNREDHGALSDSECQPTSWRQQYLKDANSNHTKVFDYVDGRTHEQETRRPSVNKSQPRAGSLNLGKESQHYREKLQRDLHKDVSLTKCEEQESSSQDVKLDSNQGTEEESGDPPSVKGDEYDFPFREYPVDIHLDSDQRSEDDDGGDGDDEEEEFNFRADVTVYRDKSVSSELMGSQDSSSTLASQPESDHEDGEATPRHKAVVVRWHSFQRGSARPDSYLFRETETDRGPIQGSRPLASLSCGQLLVLRKLALLKLTACMERYCPTHRTGWNWELPKFIRKIKTPDYKDKTVFGVPLLLSLQRTGQALPKCIQAALRWLRNNSLDQVGLFRKSGVRSRIQKLKNMTETQGETMSFEGQQAYDVADMVKQYFRELPEALLTNKLSETFIAIFQHVPNNLRAEAVQCVLLLLPDEHREALQTLLDFLSQVSSRSSCNQMTASNLAVCLAPSLFHLHHVPSSSSSSRSSSASPRRRKTVGVPDQRELGENRAAHDCLLYLIKDHKDLFLVSEETLVQCHFNYMEESIPVALEELGAEFQQDWRGYLYACTTALLKEAREKSRGWMNMPCSTDHQVEMAYKKVGDGHPLRLWRVSTEVEAPPLELLQRVLRERHVWDYMLLKWRIVARLDAQVEVFQYVCASMAPLPAKDFCVLRSWRTDLPKGACVIVETSVEHPDGPVMLGGVRGIVLASRYLIEPCGSGRSRIMHLSRVDTKGRTPEWYNKSYGHICALYLTRIRSSFKHNTEGPESKV